MKAAPFSFSAEYRGKRLMYTLTYLEYTLSPRRTINEYVSGHHYTEINIDSSLIEIHVETALLLISIVNLWHSHTCHQ